MIFLIVIFCILTSLFLFMAWLLDNPNKWYINADWELTFIKNNNNRKRDKKNESSYNRRR